MFQSCVETILDKHLSILPGFSYDSSIFCSQSFFNWETLKSDPSLKIEDLLAHSLDVDGLAMECCILGPLLWQRDALATVELDGHKERSDLWNLMESYGIIHWDSVKISDQLNQLDKVSENFVPSHFWILLALDSQSLGNQRRPEHVWIKAMFTCQEAMPSPGFDASLGPIWPILSDEKHERATPPLPFPFPGGM